MKFKNNDYVETLVDKGKFKKGSKGTVICCFDKPIEGYMVEFEVDYEDGWDSETYHFDELKLVLI